MPSGLFGPYRARRTRPATMVGNAKGRSISTSTSRFPRNWSRTNTQAMSVPMTRFTRATMRPETMVSRRADAASGAVTESQKPLTPSSEARHATAARGIRTSRLSQVVAKPTPRPTPARGRRRRGGSGPTSRGGGSSVVVLANRHADVLLDVGHDAALRVEELLRDVGPAAEVRDGEERLRGGELDAPGVDAVDHRPVPVLGENPLGRGGVEVLEERLGLLGVLGGLGDGHGVLDQDGGVRDDVVDGLVLLLGEDGLVLIRQEHLALA